MHQASNAVTVCAARQEFKLSAERIEAEKLLLISSKCHFAGFSFNFQQSLLFMTNVSTILLIPILLAFSQETRRHH
jgi:hypothetical protein